MMSKSLLRRASILPQWLVAISVFGCALGQPVPQNAGQPAGQQPPLTQPAQSPAIRPNYTLGPGDQILIRAFQMEEINDKPFRIDSEGFVDLPVVGRLMASGLTVENFEKQLAEKLRMYVREPKVTVTIVQFRSEPVFLVGAFRNPGIHPLQGRSTLVDLLTVTGGLQANASRRIKIFRRSEFGPIPLPNARPDVEGKGTSVEINLERLQDSVNPAEDLVLQPFDKISVDRAEMVYVAGEVGRVGGFELGERSSISVVQLLSMAGGLAKDAAPKNARILRPILDTARRAEIPLNLRDVLDGKVNDFPLLANDLLFVPRSRRGPTTSAFIIGFPIATSLLYLFLR